METQDEHFSRNAQHMSQRKGAAFDRQTTALLRRIVAEAEGTLPKHLRSLEMRVELATRVLSAAANGERDPGRLHDHALNALSD
jgi:hypothetical protein